MAKNTAKMQYARSNENTLKRTKHYGPLKVKVRNNDVACSIKFLAHSSTYLECFMEDGWYPLPYKSALIWPIWKAFGLWMVPKGFILKLIYFLFCLYCNCSVHSFV